MTETVSVSIAQIHEERHSVFAVLGWTYKEYMGVCRFES